MAVDDANLAVMKADIESKLDALSEEKEKLQDRLKEINMIETTPANRDMMYDKIVADHAGL